MFHYEPLHFEPYHLLSEAIDQIHTLSSQTGEFKGLLAEASEKTKNHDWAGAAQLYSNTLATGNIDPSSREYPRLEETLAECYYKAAFQAKDHEEYRRTMSKSGDAYTNSAVGYQKVGDDIASRRMKARKTFTEYWLSPDASKMLEHTRNCVAISADTISTAEKIHDPESLLYAQKDALTYIVELSSLGEEWTRAYELYHQAIPIGDATIEGFEASGKDLDLLESLHLAISGLVLNTSIPAEEFEGMKKKIAYLGEKIDAVAKRVGSAYAKSLRNDALSLIAYFSEGDPAKAMNLIEEALVQARLTRDTLIFGRLCGAIAVMACWIESPEDVDERRAILAKGIRYAPDAVQSLEVSGHPQWLSWAYSFWAECFVNLARYVETSAEEKMAQAKTALQIARRGLAYDNEENWAWCSHTHSKCLYLIATWSHDASEKKRLLTEALPLREHLVKLFERLDPHSFSQAVMWNYLALAKGELSAVEQDPETKAELLESAISDMAKCLELGSKWQTAERLVGLARFQEQYGDFLFQLYNLNYDKNDVLNSIKGYERAAEYLREAGHSGAAAALWWKIGNAHESISDYKRSSEAFKTAAVNYEEASKKHSGTVDTFSDLASYMRAWTSIQKARFLHTEEQYSIAAEDYLNAARILGITKRWKYIAGHYQACASLEKGETQSRQENHEESLHSFQSALQTFQETEKEIHEKLNENPTAENKSELENWLRITKGRQEYSQGRLDLEEAVVLDMKGEEEASGRKFGSASEIFRQLAEKSSVDQSKRELETLTFMCDAWAKMKLAEVKASPELYSQAAKSFIKVQETTASTRYRLLALAHASMCQALESGTRFRRTRDSQLYSEIKKSLETASDYYHRAGLSKAEEWIHATQRLFDALAYLTNAETEMDSKKKTELYHLSEKHLQLAAKLYEKAGYMSKRDEALKHLERAREEKELLLTPLGALADSPAIAAVRVAPVSLIRDQAVGLEKFDAAHVVGNMGLPEHECSVGADLTLELELANVGKTPATLIKLENIATPGLDINRQTSPNRYEDNYVDLRGKRLDYMKSHEVKVSLKARHKGTFELRPRILFVDEQGNYKSYQFEPTTVTVRELGISGWVKGPK